MSSSISASASSAFTVSVFALYCFPASRYDGAVVCSLLSGAERPAPTNSTLAAVNSSHGKFWNEFQCFKVSAEAFASST